MREFRSWTVNSWSQTDLIAKWIDTREVLWQWPWRVAPTLTGTLICETGSPAGNAAGALGAAAGRGSWRVCWWRGASGALKRGTPPVCAGGTSASGARRSPEPRPQTGQASPFGTCRCVCGSAARGPMSCSVARGWRRLGRSACAAARQQWSPARRSPCCTQYARWWGRSTSSLTGSACVWGGCCPSWGTSPRISSGELPEHRSQMWDPNTSLQTGGKRGWATAAVIFTRRGLMLIPEVSRYWKVAVMLRSSSDGPQAAGGAGGLNEPLSFSWRNSDIARATIADWQQPCRLQYNNNLRHPFRYFIDKLPLCLFLSISWRKYSKKRQSSDHDRVKSLLAEQAKWKLIHGKSSPEPEKTSICIGFKARLTTRQTN